MGCLMPCTGSARRSRSRRRFRATSREARRGGRDDVEGSAGGSPVELPIRKVWLEKLIYVILLDGLLRVEHPFVRLAVAHSLAQLFR